MFCNCKFHFFRGSYHEFYSNETKTIEIKYISYKEYKNVDNVRQKWRNMILNYYNRD